MGFSTGYRKCKKCGKMYLMNLFDGGLCAECENGMTDIKLVIKIPKEEYSNILKSDKSAFADCVSKECMIYAIKNGTLLNEVFDKIRADIEDFCKKSNITCDSSISACLDIINKNREEQK